MREVRFERRLQKALMLGRTARMSADKPEGATIDEATMVHRGKSVLTANVGKQIVMMDIKSGRYLGLNDIGSEIWRRLETPLPFSKLVDGLLADFEADRAVIVADVSKLLLKMAAADVVKLGA